MRKRGRHITNSRLRDVMRKYTSNENLIDICMQASVAMVGFASVAEEDFYKEDRLFMKRVKRIPNDVIDNCTIFLMNRFARVEGPNIIKHVKEDLRSLV